MKFKQAKRYAIQSTQACAFALEAVVVLRQAHEVSLPASFAWMALLTRCFWPML